MLNPTTALAWELWQRHRPRLLVIIGTFLGFAILYPMLCRAVGLQLDKADMLEEFGRSAGLQSQGEGMSFARVVHILFLLALTLGPAVAMFVSLLYVGWMFTFCEVDEKTKNPMAFPVRLFTLPVSTNFLFVRVWLGGMASVALVFLAWTYLVPMPRVEVFFAYQNGMGWLALLAMSLAIIWMPIGPNFRAVVMTVMLSAFAFLPAAQKVLELPYLFSVVLLVGTALARQSLQALRRNQFEGWSIRLLTHVNQTSAPMRGPKQFASHARAQWWFFWNQSGRRMCFFTALLTVVPVVIHLVCRPFAGVPLQGETLSWFTGYLIAVPYFLSFFYSVKPGQSIPPFVLNRPQTNGVLLMAVLKSGAISALGSWLIILACLCAMPLLGDLHETFLKKASRLDLALGAIGYLFLLWRMTAVNLPFIWSANRRLGELPVVLGVMIGPAIAIGCAVADHQAYWAPYLRLIPVLLAGALLLKLAFAAVAFRICLKRGLLQPSSIISYLSVWLGLVAVFVGTELILVPSDWNYKFPILVGTILLVPLARIAFCPIALAWNRHR